MGGVGRTRDSRAVISTDTLQDETSRGDSFNGVATFAVARRRDETARGKRFTGGRRRKRVRKKRKRQRGDCSRRGSAP